jgi:hypothetical protein
MRLLCASLLVAVFAVACGPLKYEVAATAAAVGADAKITADPLKEQGFTRLRVEIENLAPPDRVQAGAAAFVVWQRRDDTSEWIRVGALKYDEGARKALLEDATVPETRFTVQITAEEGPQVQKPGATVVFTQPVG